jgi:hypothetical protein
VGMKGTPDGVLRCWLLVIAEVKDTALGAGHVIAKVLALDAAHGQRARASRPVRQAERQKDHCPFSGIACGMSVKMRPRVAPMPALDVRKGRSIARWMLRVMAAEEVVHDMVWTESWKACTNKAQASRVHLEIVIPNRAD